MGVEEGKKGREREWEGESECECISHHWMPFGKAGAETGHSQEMGVQFRFPTLGQGPSYFSPLMLPPRAYISRKLKPGAELRLEPRHPHKGCRCTKATVSNAHPYFLCSCCSGIWDIGDWTKIDIPELLSS